MIKLLPAAQAVDDATCYDMPNKILAAAAIRAAAANQNKQIDVPFSKIDQWEKIKGNTLSYWTAAQWGYQKAMSELLDIAIELENQ
jgi:hypothetical protein